MSGLRYARILGLALVAIVFAFAAAQARAAGFLVPTDGSAPIRLRSHRVTAVVEDGLARTTVRQEFVNPHGRALEAVYVFPVPEDAAIVDLAMEVGGQRLEGLLAERRTARRAYDSLVRRNIDPALVEQIGRGKFRLSVFPVMPDQPTVVEITWIQRVPLVQDEMRYVYPLALAEGAATTERDLTVSVTMRSSAPFDSVATPTEGVHARIVAPHEVRATLERTSAALGRDIVVTATVAAQEPTLAVRTFRGATGEPYFSAVVTPPRVAEDQVLARDITLVIDTSGSMAGGKLDQAKASARWLLANVRPRDRVNVLLFSDEVRRLFHSPVDATPENLAALREFVDDSFEAGSTALGDALRAASAAPVASGRVAMTVLLTDGQATVGETSAPRIIEYAKAGSDRGLRTFAFGVGGDVDAALLQGVAQAGRGTCETFRPAGEIESRLRTFLTRTSSPVLANLRLEIGGRPVDDLLPRPLPDLFLGEQAVMTGRVRLEGEHEVVVRGVLAGKEIALRARAVFPKEPGGAPVVRDLYARDKLVYLEQAVRLRAGLNDEAYFAALDRGAYSTQDELVKAIVDLSLESGVQCPYTSFFALLPEDRARLDPRDAAAIDAALVRATAKRREVAALGRANEPGGEARPAAPATPSPDDAPLPGDLKVPHRDEDEPPPTPEETKPLEESERVREDPFPWDPKSADDDLDTEESLGDPRFDSDSPFEGPGANGTIGIGGGAGGAFGGRRGGHRNLRAGRAGKTSQAAVDRALDWLRAHQEPDGRWSAAGFHERCTLNRCGGAGASDADVGSTGLALLSLLGAGETHLSGSSKDTVKGGLKYLRAVQDVDGCIGPRTSPRWMFDHLAATLAMTEAYGMTQSVIFKDAAQRGVNFIHLARNPNSGWGLGVRDGNCDTAATVWALMCLRSAQLAELEVDLDAFRGGLAWLDAVTDPATGLVAATARGAVPTTSSASAQTPSGATGFPGRSESALLGGAVFVRFQCHAALGSDAATIGKDAAITLGAARLRERFPRWDIDAGTIDLAAWSLGALAAFQVGGETWKLWYEAMESAVVRTQRIETARDERGSWDPDPSDPGSAVGGRVQATAFSALCLETFYRYGRVLGGRR